MEDPIYQSRHGNVCKRLCSGRCRMCRGTIIQRLLRTLPMSPLPDDPLEHALRQKLLARTRDDVSAMRSAAQSREFAVVVRLAHRLAGAAGALGFDALCDAAQALEAHGERRDATQVHARLDAVAAELERARALPCP